MWKLGRFRDYVNILCLVFCFLRFVLVIDGKIIGEWWDREGIEKF